MWILESSGDFLQGKRMWLKPGKKYLFGRVKKDGVRFAIDHKTVSRKHFVINVDPVQDEDVGRIHSRTLISITDENSKAGTNIDGHLIKGKTQRLVNLVNSIRPGNCPYELLINWQPFVLTFNLLKKEIKNGALKTKQERVKELDIKAISEYVTDETTHLVAAKRNTAKGLQALIEAKHIVLESYVDSLIYAATPADLEEEENLCPLELDFDDSWPDPFDHLPPVGKEPTTKPAESYQPDPARGRVFQNYSFVFTDQSQYDNLLPAVTSGHGKAYLFKTVAGETTAEEAITFIRGIAGHKSFSAQQAGAKEGGTVVVRWNEPPEFQQWATDFFDFVALKLGQRVIDQSEFIDAILSNDVSLLRQSTSVGQYDSKQNGTGTSTKKTRHAADGEVLSGRQIKDSSHGIELANPSAQSPVPMRQQSEQNGSSASPVDHDHQEAPKVSYRQARFVPPKRSRVKDFEDDFNPESISAYDDEDHDDRDNHDDVPATHTRARDARVHPEAVQPTDQGKGRSLKAEEDTRTSRKRTRSPAPSSNASGDDDLIDNLLPATTAFKKRRLEIEAEARRNGTHIDQPVRRVAETVPAPAPKKPKIEKEINMREAFERRKKEAEEANRHDDGEGDLEPFDTENKEPANLVEVCDMELPVRGKITHDGGGGDDSSLGGNVREINYGASHNDSSNDRWDPKWNGRKNFKQFRRARDNLSTMNGNGAHVPPRRDHNKLIVPVAEVKKNSYGIGDQYWEKSQEDKEREAREKERERRRRANDTTTATTTVTRGTTPRPSNKERVAQNTRSQNPESLEGKGEADVAGDGGSEDGFEEDDFHQANNDDDDQAGGEGEDAASSFDTTQSRTRTQVNSKPLGRMGAATDVNSNGKRLKRPGSRTAASKPVAPKRQKTLNVRVIHGSDSESEDSDDMKFKFGRSSRGGKGKSRI